MEQSIWYERRLRLLGLVWLVLGVFLPILYLTPLFGTALYNLNGIDVLSLPQDFSADKLKTFDQTSGFLMLVLPQLMLFIGFWGIAMGLSAGFKVFKLSRRPKGLIMALAISCGVIVLLGLVCSIRLGSASSGFFAMMMPKAQSGFHLMLGVVALMGLAPVVLRYAVLSGDGGK